LIKRESVINSATVRLVQETPHYHPVLSYAFVQQVRISILTAAFLLQKARHFNQGIYKGCSLIIM
jgi:hypothetical protein